MTTVELPEPRLEGHYRVGPRRRIGFAEYGDPNGRVIFWFHGTPGGRRQIAPRARVVARERGIRLIVLERPGVGFSTPHLYENVLGFADDVGTIADRLGIEEFAITALSGSGRTHSRARIAFLIAWSRARCSVVSRRRADPKQCRAAWSASRARSRHYSNSHTCPRATRCIAAFAS
jgi:pimeloyl-ACP methyl ester carboxylesterase